jgi:hypothetical protein
MENAERTAIDMIRRYRTSEAAIQQAHAYDVEAITDEERGFLARRVGRASFVRFTAFLIGTFAESRKVRLQGDRFGG